MPLKRILAFLLPLLLCGIEYSSCLAQNCPRPLRHVGRHMGLGWGNGYHSRNPGADTGYYNVYTPQNSSLMGTGGISIENANAESAPFQASVNRRRNPNRFLSSMSSIEWGRQSAPHAQRSFGYPTVQTPANGPWLSHSNKAYRPMTIVPPRAEPGSTNPRGIPRHPVSGDEFAISFDADLPVQPLGSINGPRPR